MTYEDPVATAIFALEEEIAAYSSIKKLELLLKLSDNDRLTDHEYRRFARACAKRST